MKVEVIDRKTGKTKSMQARYAKILVDLKLAGYPRGNDVQTHEKVVDPEYLVSGHVRDYAAESGIDLAKVIGTGTNGRITKKDVEAQIKPQE